MRTMTDKQANAVYDVLVQECGAAESYRGDFVADQTKEEIREWRFGGRLGFGGKLWVQSDWTGKLSMAVACYSEDMTAERQAIIFKANERLKAL